ncbi:MAG: hypothetical protein ACYCSO_03960 [Cuniculiplasma sp.]
MAVDERGKIKERLTKLEADYRWLKWFISGIMTAFITIAVSVIKYVLFP